MASGDVAEGECPRSFFAPSARGEGRRDLCDDKIEESDACDTCDSSDSVSVCGCDDKIDG